jgi:hypothetical protein
MREMAGEPQNPSGPTDVAIENAGYTDTCNDRSDPANWKRLLGDQRKLGEWVGFKVDDYGNILKLNTDEPGTVIARLKDHKFSWFADGHPAHFGYTDYEGQINERWYHVSVRKPDGGDSIFSPHDTKPYWLVWPGQPPNITIRCEEFYLRPSGMHRVQWFYKYFPI